MPLPSTKEILAEFRSIRKELRTLREELALHPSKQITAMFKRRGFTYMAGNPYDKLLLPPAASPETGNALYKLLRKYSFRLFLRDVIKQTKSFTPRAVGEYSSSETVKGYVDVLLSHNILKKKSRRLSLASPSVYSFGDTFEWYVSNVFTREFLCPSQWGVKLRELQCGGDLDVVALVDGRFVYVEVKSSPPKHIEQNEISAFFDRVLELRPDAAIFLEDTRLRMKDKIVVMFEEELKKRWPDATVAVERMKGELFKVGEKLFIINSKPDVCSNIAYCLSKALSAPVLPPVLKVDTESQPK
ncbi:MAG: hypothetical protein AMJ46_08835 [Latescibacteria bacterium DG_63]|nr:MAG: hypothetical protein AMJ46_08835 [Latescibacteria bacterium DG_63]